MEIEAYNNLFLTRVAAYLNDCPDAIDRNAVRETAEDCGLSERDAYLVLLAIIFELF
ncbi:MAG: hypothetical protein IKI59_03435 [Clostridia bacterium]|nr:hypothetical protein [Clostridia bacterium]